MAKPIRGLEDLWSVAEVASNGDGEIVKIISDIHHKIGI